MLFRAGIVSRGHKHVRLLHGGFVFRVARMGRSKDQFVLSCVGDKQRFYLKTNRKSIRRNFLKRPADAVNGNGVVVCRVANVRRPQTGQAC